MPGTEWPFTVLGRQFFDGTLPRLCRALEKIAKSLERGKEVPHSCGGAQFFLSDLIAVGADERLPGSVELYLRGLGHPLSLRASEAERDLLLTAWRASRGFGEKSE
jgi:hypothetical protein